MASPDFLVIPHQLILDARLQPLDRIVYGVVYWYAKMKDGQCYASNATLAQSCGPDTKPGSVQDALTRLEACGYIERVYSSPKVRKEVIPLVSMGRVSANADRGIGKCRQRVSANADQSINSNNNNYPEAAVAGEVPNPEEEKAIGEVIKAFEPFTPEAKKFYGRPPQREAARSLVRDPNIGLSRVKVAMATLYRNREDRFAPLVDSPLELSRKWAKVYRYVKPRLSDIDD